MNNAHKGWWVASWATWPNSASQNADHRKHAKRRFNGDFDHCRQQNGGNLFHALKAANYHSPAAGSLIQLAVW